MEGNQTDRRFRHLAIAGTGRAGTSFLVRYLTGLGLDTALSRRGDAAFWDEEANAGLEDDLATGIAGELPYVAKSPWLFETIDRVLARPDIALDAVIVPMRDLVEAATSRTLLEMRAAHQAAPWMAELDRSWETWASTPGGVIYSLNPLDQGRLLAVGFHQLLERLAAADVPVVLLAFPKFVEDAGYLYRRLRPVLPPDVTEALATEVHGKIADRSKVRVGDELRATKAGRPHPAQAVCAYPQQEELDHLAVRRELARVRREASAHAAAAADASARLQASNAEVEALRQALTRAEEALARAEGERAQAATEATRAASVAAERESAEADALRAELAALRQSRSWRLLHPLRVVASMAQRRRD